LLTEFIAVLHVLLLILLLVLPENNKSRMRPFGNRNSYQDLIELLLLIPPHCTTCLEQNVSLKNLMKEITLLKKRSDRRILYRRYRPHEIVI